MSCFCICLWIFLCSCLPPSSSSTSHRLCPPSVDGRLCLRPTDGTQSLLRVPCAAAAALTGGVIDPSHSGSIPGRPTIENETISADPPSPDKAEDESGNRTLVSCIGDISATTRSSSNDDDDDATYRLNLSSLRIAGLDDVVFHGQEVTSLQEIDLSENALPVLDVEVFAPLRSLRFLDLSGNRLEHIVAGSNFSHATGNNLSHVTGLDRLELLNISRNLLSSFDPEDVAKFDHLSLLDASHNHMTALRIGGFSCMGALRTLDLSHNLLTSLRNYTFVNLYGLVSVNLSHNAIEDLEVDAFFTWQSGNCSGGVGGGGGGGDRMRNSTIFGAREKNRPDPGSTTDGCSVSRWPALETLDLSHNAMTSIRETAFRSVLCGIRELYLGFNRIAHLPRYVIEQLRCLTVIDLRHNEIFWLDVGIFTNPSLRSVDLSFNRLRKIISMAFLYLPSVLSIDLSYNEIGYIYKYAFYRLCKDDHRSIRISLRGNRLQTDGLWKMLSVFQHQEDGACAADVDMRDNHVTRFLGDAVKQVRGETTTTTATADRKRFDRWQRVSVDLEGNGIRCDCSTAEELSILAFIERSAVLPRSLSKNLAQWTLLNCSAEFEGEVDGGMKVKDLLESNRCPGLTRFACPPECDCRADDRKTGSNLVDCSNRSLTEFPEFPIENRTDLVLSRNDLTELRSTDDSQLLLRRLRSLDLSHNRLRHLDGQTIQRMSAVEELFLDHNDLKRLPEEIRRLPRLTNLTLRGNPLSCGCADVWVPEVAVRMRRVVSDFPLVVCSDGTELSVKVIGRESACRRQLELFGGRRLDGSSSGMILILVGILPMAVVAVVVTVYRSQTRTAMRVQTGGLGQDTREDLFSSGSADVFLCYRRSDEDWIGNSLLRIIRSNFPQCVIRSCPDLDPSSERLLHLVDGSISKVTLLVASKEFFHQGSWKAKSHQAAIREKMDNSPCGRFLVIGRGRRDDLDPSEFIGQSNKVTWLLTDDDSCFEQNLVRYLSIALADASETNEGILVEDSEDETQRLEKY